MPPSRKKLLIFGFGYTARAFAERLGDDWDVLGTSRDGKNGCLRFDRTHPLAPGVFAGVSHVLDSIPPDASGDPVLAAHSEDIARIAGLRWLGYLSTTGVYGTRDGGWVDENSALRPTGSRGAARVAAEAAWLRLCREHGLPVHLFRLAGIYGPGRSAFDALRAGSARRIDAGPQVFSRIHVDDVATVLLASIANPRPGAAYNVCDDVPAVQEAVVAHAAGLLGIEPPPLVPLAEAALSPMARSFYADNKRVSSALIKRELGVTLTYPSYREGLAAVLAAGG
jgi:nucleoside-diphosphate-sugar epimerase